MQNNTIKYLTIVIFLSSGLNLIGDDSSAVENYPFVNSRKKTSFYNAAPVSATPSGFGEFFYFKLDDSGLIYYRYSENDEWLRLPHPDGNDEPKFSMISCDGNRLLLKEKNNNELWLYKVTDNFREQIASDV